CVSGGSKQYDFIMPSKNSTARPIRADQLIAPLLAQKSDSRRGDYFIAGHPSTSQVNFVHITSC
ncbi:MAG: hypothetical protein QGG55_10540, partial [Verrucomicrobiota bacterium]|nr:hypothetical protein [Verrucomicrobiota bacterium]